MQPDQDRIQWEFMDGRSGYVDVPHQELDVQLSAYVETYSDARIWVNDQLVHRGWIETDERSRMF